MHPTEFGKTELGKCYMSVSKSSANAKKQYWCPLQIIDQLCMLDVSAELFSYTCITKCIAKIISVIQGCSEIGSKSRNNF